MAESTPGFVWRHLTVNDDSEAKQVFAEPNLVFNMSVWESQQALREFVYKSDHASILRQRADWFVPMNRPVFALWWQPVGTIPTIVESRHRLERLQQAWPTEGAFTFRNFIEVPLAQEIANG